MARKGRPEKVSNAVRRAVKSGKDSVVTKGSKPRRVDVAYDVKKIQESKPARRKRGKKK